MAALSTPLPKLSGNANLKVLPSSTPIVFPIRSAPRTPNRRLLLGSENGLFLKRVIGCSTTAFDSHPASRSFAYMAGAAAVVVQLDDDLNVHQRFFRARPNAPIWSSASSQFGPMQNLASMDSRNRLSLSLKDIGIGYSPGSIATPSVFEDSQSSKTWTARERIKAAACVSFSPDGKFLAVGETGYNPRVLIFTTSRDVPSDIPIASMTEHTFGVRHVAFSPCSKYLASIGTINDGFVYIWSINHSVAKGTTVKLHSSNKCTSVIRGITWMGKHLVTVGTRHVKLWKLDEDNRPTSPNTKPLNGRNVLLGPMADAVMTCVVGISEDKALVCSEKGDICLIDESQIYLARIANAEFGISCITADAESKFAWVAGKNGQIRAVLLKDIVPSTPPISPSSSRSGSPVFPYGCRPANITAMASMLGHLFTLDSNHSIKIISMSKADGIPVPDRMVRELPAHRDSVLGVRLFPPKFHIQDAAFYTWSAGGLVLFWSLEGINRGDFQVQLEQPQNMGEEDISNELRVVRISPDGDLFVTGDKFGVLRVIDAETCVCLYAVKAHSGDITDITIRQTEKTKTIVSCGRDRTVQVFQQVLGTFTLAQTLDEHTASVSKVLLLEGGSRLLSCSTDRTVVIRELAEKESDGVTTSAYIPIRTLVMKSSPLHMTPVSDSLPHLIVSTADRHIQKYDMNTGKLLHSFKASDESGEGVVMDCIGLNKERSGGRRLLAGIATTDKSIRIYDINGTLIDKEWGHTEGVSDVAILETGSDDNDSDSMTVISTGADGTILIWDFNPRNNEGNGSDSSSSSKGDFTATKTPLRKILSKSELVEFTPKQSDKDVIQGTPSGVSSANNSPPRTVKKRNSAYGMNKNLPMSKLPQGIVRTETGKSDGGGDSTPTTPLFGSELAAPTAPEPRKRLRDRSSSPPDPAKLASSRRSSSDNRIRGKSVGNVIANATNGTNGTNGINGTNSTNGTATAPSNDPNSVNALAEGLLKSLRAFREGMGAASAKGIKPETLKELEKELGSTTKELGGGGLQKKKSNLNGVNGSANGNGNGNGSVLAMPNEFLMAELLEQYSQRLMSMIDSRLDEKLLKDPSAIKGRGTGLECKRSEELSGEG